MNKKLIFELKSLYRDSLRIYGYEFGEGEKSVCVVGAMRGNEIQQLLASGMLVKELKKYEKAGKIKKGKSIMVIPSVNPYSMNIQKRFWPTDNTDINRMFPGYDKGETTQRIAAAVFNAVKDYENGIQFASFYMPGNFLPHVRIMRTGYENPKLAAKFGMPYIILRDPKPYDSTTLNYNWQVWETNAFSVYTNGTDTSDPESVERGVEAVITFLKRTRVIDGDAPKSEMHIINERDLYSVSSKEAGVFKPMVRVNQRVEKGDVLAKIINPYDFSVKKKIKSEADGVVFFEQNNPLALSNAVLFKIIRN